MSRLIFLYFFLSYISPSECLVRFDLLMKVFFLKSRCYSSVLYFSPVLQKLSAASVLIVLCECEHKYGSRELKKNPLIKIFTLEATKHLLFE